MAASIPGGPGSRAGNIVPTRQWINTAAQRQTEQRRLKPRHSDRSILGKPIDVDGPRIVEKGQNGGLIRS